MPRTDLSPEGFDRIARQIKDYIDGEQLTLLPIDHGGLAVYRHLVQALQKYGIRYVRYVLKHDPDLFAEDHVADNKDDYREIVGVVGSKSKRVFGLRHIRDVIRIKNRKAAIIDHDIHHGHSLAGATKHVLDFYAVYGIEEDGLFSVVAHDGLGYAAHFAVSRDYSVPMELNAVLKSRLIDSYPIYETDGRLKLIADMPTIHMPKLEPVDITTENGTSGKDVLPLHIG